MKCIECGKSMSGDKANVCHSRCEGLDDLSEEVNFDGFLLDRFAGMAMQGYLASGPKATNYAGVRRIADQSYDMAGMMMKVREEFHGRRRNDKSKEGGDSSSEAGSYVP